MEFVKVYGMQRSGTNVLKFLLEANFRNTVVVDLPLGNKHEPPRPAEALLEWRSMEHYPVYVERLPYTITDLQSALGDDRVRAVAIVKPLLPWLVSFYRYRRLKEPERYATLAPKMVQQWTRRWVDVNTAFVTGLAELPWRHYVVDYRKLLEDVGETLEHLQAALELTQSSSGQWVSADRVMKRSSDEVHGQDVLSDRAFDAGYYASRSYLAELSPELCDVVHEELRRTDDPGVLAGYLDEELRTAALIRKRAK